MKVYIVIDSMRDFMPMDEPALVGVYTSPEAAFTAKHAYAMRHPREIDCAANTNIYEAELED
jgi:hypothetical protein